MGLPRESSLKARFPRSGQTPRASAETQATVARQRGCQRGERDLLKNTSRGANRRTFGLSNRSSTRTRPSACRPTSESAEGRDDIFKLWIEGGFGSEGIGRLHCVVTLADLPPAVAAYVRRPGDSTWCALTLDVLRIEDGLMTEIVTFMPHNFPFFGLLMMDAPPEMNKCH